MDLTPNSYNLVTGENWYAISTVSFGLSGQGLGSF